MRVKERKMTSRERVREAINHHEPDRIPLDLGGLTTGINIYAYHKLLDYLGMREEVKLLDPIQQLAQPSEQVLQKLEIDTRYIRPREPSNWKLEIEKVKTSKGVRLQYTDEWGVVRAMPEKEGNWFDIVDAPLKQATMKDLDKYNWPDPQDPARFKELREEAQELYNNTDYAIVSDVTGSMFELAWYLRGFENWLTDLVINQAFAEKLLDILMKWWMDFYEVYLKEIGEYIDVIWVGDDIAMQTAPLYSLDIHRKIVKPRQKMLYDYIHARTDAKICYHGCGSMHERFQELIDVGVDIVNPVQVSALGMNTAQLKVDFGDKLSFWGGGCDTQNVLPRGTPKEVEKEVKTRIHDLAPGGGFVFAAVHNIQKEVPPRNIVRMFETAKNYGSYPILI